VFLLFRRIFDFSFSPLMLDENQYPPSFDTINKVNNIIYSDFFFKWRFFFKTFFLQTTVVEAFVTKLDGKFIFYFFPFLILKIFFHQNPNGRRPSMGSLFYKKKNEKGERLLVCYHFLFDPLGRDGQARLLFSTLATI
jgi:hypothetical protein